MSNVLFVNPFFLKDSALERRWMTPYFPLGLLCLAAVTRAEGHLASVFDGTFQAGDEAFLRSLTEHRLDVVCIGSLITLRPAALRLAQFAAQQGAHIIFGGPDPTLEPGVYLEGGAVVVTGEGERTLIDLLATLESGSDLAQVAGIAYRDNSGDIVQTMAREPIWNLDTLPLAARDLIDVGAYLSVWKQTHGYSSLTMAVSRGCPYGCEHCANSVMGPHLRRRSPDNVAAEMKMIEDTFMPDRFRLVDDLEGLGEEWLITLGNAMIAAGVRTLYEGLKPLHMAHLPMLNEEKDLCAERNEWLPTQDTHSHAPPALDLKTLQRRWQQGTLLENERLNDP